MPTTTIVKYKDWTFEVDFSTTKNTYDNANPGGADTCPCAYCKNFVANRDKYLGEAKEFFQSIGIDYKKDCETYWTTKLENGKHLYNGWFHFKGKIVSGPTCKSIDENKVTNIKLHSVSDNLCLGFYPDDTMSFFDNKDELVQVEFETAIPWTLENEAEPD